MSPELSVCCPRASVSFGPRVKDAKHKQCIYGLFFLDEGLNLTLLYRMQNIVGSRGSHVSLGHKQLLFYAFLARLRSVSRIG